jgi:glycosyltransferase involved in cell wall biosynthesis
MRLLFVDAVCPKPYDPEVLATQPLGGTEATVIRVAEALGDRGVTVQVAQHCRKDTSALDGACYVPFGFKRDAQPSHVVVLRAPGALRQARKQFPSAKLYLWCHDIFSGPGWADGFQAIVDTQAIPIVVSEWHRAQMYDAMRQLGVNASVPCRRIYNPIADDLKPDETPVDPDKLVFFSSPHKGLEHTLKIFERFQDFPELRGMKLYVANPGYFADHKVDNKSVVNLGSLPHSEVIAHVRSALAVLHLNAVFPETFGLVHAEANAVGTPFLTSRMGAVPETADHPAEVIDVTDPKAVIDRMIDWRTRGRPRVRGNPAFRLSRVVSDWLDLLRL